MTVLLQNQVQKKNQVSIWQIFRYRNYILIFFFFSNSMAKSQQNPHCIHPLSEVIGFPALEKDWLCRVTVFTSAGSRTSKVKPFLFIGSCCPLTACSMRSVVSISSPVILWNRFNPSLNLYVILSGSGLSMLPSMRGGLWDRIAEEDSFD